jgi:hypothetical protein
MLFMIVERFKDNHILPIYKRVRDEGRMVPPKSARVTSGCSFTSVSLTDVRQSGRTTCQNLGAEL